MARQEIILGAPPQGLGGDPPRTASMKINAMTAELYAATEALVKVASLTDSTPGRLVTPGWMGLGSSPISMPNTDNADTLPAISARFIFGNGGINLPASYMFIDQFSYGMGGYTRQLGYELNSDRMWERFFVAGSADNKPWTPIYNGVSALLDPSSGGLMSSTVVSGFTVEKYANGRMTVTSGVILTPSIAATDIAIQAITLPVSFISTSSMMVKFSCSPVAALDSYGAVMEDIVSVSSVRCAIRNGQTVQAFNIRVKVWGNWK